MPIFSTAIDNGSMLYGYARAFDHAQDADQQARDLRALGVHRDNITVEYVPALESTPQPQLREVLDRLRAGDVFVTPMTNRLAGSFTDLREIYKELQERGLSLQIGQRVFHAHSADFTVMLETVDSLIEYERQNQRLARKISAEPRTLDPNAPPHRTRLTKSQQERVRTLVSQDQHTYAQIAEMFKVSVSTIRRIASMPTPSSETPAPSLSLRPTNRGRRPSLTNEQTQSVIALYETGEYTQEALAQLFKVHFSTIKRILAADRAAR